MEARPAEIRSGFAKMVWCILQTYLDVVSMISEDSMQIEERNEYEPYFTMVLEKLLQILGYSEEKWFYFDGYFEIFCRMLDESSQPTTLKWFLESGLLEEYVKWFLIDDINNGSKLPKSMKMKRRGKVNNYETFLELISNIVCSCEFTSDGTNLPSTFMDFPDDREPVKIEEISFNFLGKLFLSKLIKSAVTQKARFLVSKILRHMFWDSLQNTEIILTILLKFISESEYDALPPFLTLYNLILSETEDECSEQRIHTFLPKLTQIIEDKKRFPKKFATFMAHLHNMARGSPSIAKFITSQPKVNELLKLYRENERRSS